MTATSVISSISEAVPRPSETGTRTPEEVPSTSLRPEKVTSTLQISVSEVATNDEYIDLDKMHLLPCYEFSASMWTGQPLQRRRSRSISNLV